MISSDSSGFVVKSIGALAFAAAITLNATSEVQDLGRKQELMEIRLISSTALLRPSVIASETYTAPSEYQNAIERLKRLSFLESDHDGTGAMAPSLAAINRAISFVESLPFYAPAPSVGVDEAGSAVVEFHEADEFGQLTFAADGLIEAFFSQNDIAPELFSGRIGDTEFLHRFKSVFGFSLVA